MLYALANKTFKNLESTSKNLLINHTQKDYPIFPTITRKSWLNLLGIIFQENPTNWNMQFKELIRKASSRMYICKFANELDILFNSLITPLFMFGKKYGDVQHINVDHSKYIVQIDRLLNRAF